MIRKRGVVAGLLFGVVAFGFSFDLIAQTEEPELSNVAPVAHWRFDETAGFSALNSNGGINGTLTAMASDQWDQANNIVGNSSLRFDGGNERVTLETFDFGGPQISFMGWIRPSDVDASGGKGRLISKASGNAERSHFLMLSTDKNENDVVVPRVRLKTGVVTTTLLGDESSIISNDQWFHIAATYNGSEMILYSNGQNVGLVEIQGNVASNLNVPTAIGNQPLGGRGLVGLIDDVCVFDVALTPQDIAFLYNNGAGRSCDRLVQNGNNSNSFIPGLIILLDED